MSGIPWVRNTLLWLLLDEGVSSRVVLLELGGFPPGSLDRTLHALKKEGLVQRADDLAVTRGTRVRYSLTRAGIEAALLVRPDQIDLPELPCGAELVL